MAILSVEDQPEDQIALEKHFRRGPIRNVTLLHARNSEETMRIVREQPVDCVLLDYYLPDGNGLDVLQTLDAGGFLERLPVIVITGRGTETAGVSAMRHGAQDYLFKEGLTPESLWKAIDLSLERLRAAQQLRTQRDELERRNRELQATVSALEDARQLNARMAGIVPVFLYVYDLVEQRNVYCNRSVGTVLGYEVDELTDIGKLLIPRFIHPDDQAATQVHMERLRTAKDGERIENEFRMRHRDGSWRWIRSVDTPFARASDGSLWQIIGTAEDFTDRKAQEDRLRLFEKVVVNTRDAVMITEAEPIDLPGPRIVYVNPAFTEMTGYSAEETIGGTPRMLQGPKSDRHELDRVRKALKRWKPVRVELTNYRKDGSEFDVEFEIVPVADTRGWFTHWVSVQRDTTERRAAERALRSLTSELEVRVAERTEALQISNDELNGFCYAVAHDMRTPLRTIDASCRILIEDLGSHLDADDREHLERQSEAARRLGTLIDDLLRYAKLGRQAMEVEPIDLTALAGAVAGRLTQPGWPGEGVGFIVAPGMRAVGDPAQIEIVLNILFENAAKYRHARRAVKVLFWSVDVPGGRTFVVEDNGIGFDMQYVGKLFKPFQRLHRDGDYPGTGIGLANARRIVERHGGRIWAEGRPGEGATFCFTLGPTHADR